MVQLLHSPEEFSASSEPDQSGFLYAPPDHFLWSARRTPELDHSLANVFVQANINQFGEMAVAGCGSYMKIQGFGFLPITCFALALTTFISQNLGAKEYERAKKGAVFGVICSLTISELLGICVHLPLHSFCLLSVPPQRLSATEPCRLIRIPFSTSCLLFHTVWQESCAEPVNPQSRCMLCWYAGV